MLAVGTPAPDFELSDQNGETRRLSDYRGQTVVLYFYPRDNTAGCTRQACGFTELRPQFELKGATVIGISKDTVASHKRFEQRQNLGITLLADPELEVIKAYDVWHEKRLYGKTSFGVVRTTYVIDAEGVITHAAEKVKAADNPAQTLELLG